MSSTTASRNKNHLDMKIYEILSLPVLDTSCFEAGVHVCVDVTFSLTGKGTSPNPNESVNACSAQEIFVCSQRRGNTMTKETVSSRQERGDPISNTKPTAEEPILSIRNSQARSSKKRGRKKGLSSHRRSTRPGAQPVPTTASSAGGLRNFPAEKFRASESCSASNDNEVECVVQQEQQPPLLEAHLVSSDSESQDGNNSSSNNRPVIISAVATRAVPVRWYATATIGCVALIAVIVVVVVIVVLKSNNNGTPELTFIIGNLDKNQRVTGIYLTEASGTIPSTIGLLQELTSLAIEQTELTGTLPTQLGLLRNLTALSFKENFLTGPIPSELGFLLSLLSLNLGVNELTGSIPSELGALTQLTALVLAHNKLTGAIPSELAALDGLTELRLESTDLV